MTKQRIEVSMLWEINCERELSTKCYGYKWQQGQAQTQLQGAGFDRAVLFSTPKTLKVLHRCSETTGADMISRQLRVIKQ